MERISPRGGTLLAGSDWNQGLLVFFVLPSGKMETDAVTVVMAEEFSIILAELRSLLRLL